MFKLFEKMKRIPSKLKWITSKPGIGVACFVVGLVVGIGGLVFVQNYNPADEQDTVASTVFARIVKQNELVTVSQNYTVVDKAEDANQLFGIDIPFTGNSFWYRYTGTLKAGVNLENATYELADTQITVTLEEPYIISNTPDMEKTGVLEERGNVLNPIHIEDVDEFQRRCVDQSELDAVEGGLLRAARTNAETNIANMFGAALGDEYTVKFVWHELGDESEQQAEEQA